jgi:hypothetical protein
MPREAISVRYVIGQSSSLQTQSLYHVAHLAHFFHPVSQTSSTSTSAAPPLSRSPLPSASFCSNLLSHDPNDPLKTVHFSHEAFNLPRSSSGICFVALRSLVALSPPPNACLWSIFWPSQWKRYYQATLFNRPAGHLLGSYPYST